MIVYPSAALPQERHMDYHKLSTEALKQIEATARQEIQKGEAQSTSKRIMKARYGVLGAVSAVLATR